MADMNPDPRFMLPSLVSGYIANIAWGLCMKGTQLIRGRKRFSLYGHSSTPSMVTTNDTSKDYDSDDVGIIQPTPSQALMPLS